MNGIVDPRAGLIYEFPQRELILAADVVHRRLVVTTTRGVYLMIRQTPKARRRMRFKARKLPPRVGAVSLGPYSLTPYGPGRIRGWNKTKRAA